MELNFYQLIIYYNLKNNQIFIIIRKTLFNKIIIKKKFKLIGYFDCIILNTIIKNIFYFKKLKKGKIVKI